MKKYKFKLPIGDWSGDGHGRADYYVIESNKPVEEVREIYFQACENLGFTLGGHGEKTPCSDYEDYKFPKETLKELLDFGVKLDKDTIDYINKQESTDGTELFADIVIGLIMAQDKTLKLKRLSGEEMPMLPFYGFDKKGRHMGFFGYGLFE